MFFATSKGVAEGTTTELVNGEPAADVLQALEMGTEFD